LSKDKGTWQLEKEKLLTKTTKTRVLILKIGSNKEKNQT
jgi:hypothetical protein